MRTPCLIVIGGVMATLLLAGAAPARAQQRGLTVPPPAGGLQGTFGRYRAILFAVGEQQASSDLPSLRFPVSEADSLRSVLVRQYTFDSSDVRVVRNPTADQIVDALDSLAALLGPTDNLLVLYSGHGVYDRDGQEGYWQASDARSGRKSSWLANSEVRTVMRKLRARQVLVVTDACFSGALTRGGGSERTVDGETYEFGARLSQRTSRRAITAGNFDEPVPAASVFAVELVKALRGNQADVMTAGRLAYAIRPAVAAVARTSVQYGQFAGVADEQGGFVFVSRTARPRTAAELANDAPPREPSPRAPTPREPSGREPSRPSRDVPATTGTGAGRTEPRATTSITGCWRYGNGGVLQMRPDGTVTGAPWPGRWTAEPGDRLHITWPVFTDSLTLDRDGEELRGINNYGLRASATRVGKPVTNRQQLTGEWLYNTLRSTARADGTIVADPYSGRWRSPANGIFVIQWTHHLVDDVSVLREGSTLMGSNTLGAMIQAARTSCP